MPLGNGTGLTKGRVRKSRGPNFSVRPAASGTTVVGDVITVTFTPQSAFAMTCTVRFYRDGTVVQTTTPAVTTGTQVTATYTTAAPGVHWCEVELVDSQGKRRSGAPAISHFAAGGPFSAAFSDAFQRSF